MCEDCKPMPWEIDDVVYYLDESDRGHFPEIRRAHVEEIHRSTLRLRPAGTVERDNLVFVDRGLCYRDVEKLLATLRNHLNNETTRLEGVVYEW